jgi:hypothetical protein
MVYGLLYFKLLFFICSKSIGNGSFDSNSKKPKHSAARVPSKHSAALRLASASGKASNATINCEAFVFTNQTMSLVENNLLGRQRRNVATSKGTDEAIYFVDDKL